MSTKIRPEVSEKNKYWISRENYYELKHFCMQYREWKDRYNELYEKMTSGNSVATSSNSSEIFKPTERYASEMAELSRKMTLVEETVKKADPDIANWLFKAVTESRSFTWLKASCGMPCEKDMYYDRYRKFFWLLSQER